MTKMNRTNKIFNTTLVTRELSNPALVNRNKGNRDENNFGIYPVNEFIDVEKSPSIKRGRNYTVIITNVEWQQTRISRAHLLVRFEVKNGLYKEAWFKCKFYCAVNSIRSLSKLCTEVGLKGMFQDTRQLMGKELIVKVNK